MSTEHKHDAETASALWSPEGCILVAHDTGDGWALMVENQQRDVIAYLEWPKAWPEVMSPARLREIGFEIV